MLSNNVEIRPAQTADMSDLADLILACFRYYWDVQDGDEVIAANTTKNLLNGNSGCTAIIALLEGKPAGFATYTILHSGLTEAGTLFLKDLFIDKNARGAGLGKSFMHHLANIAKDVGCERFDWTAEKDNPKALEFYKSIGAKQVEEKVYFRFDKDDLEQFVQSN